MIEKSQVLQILDKVKDPEIPVVSVVEMGMIRDVEIETDTIHIILTPTYSGCPATYEIRKDVVTALNEQGYEKVKIEERLYPAWTTDWMTEETLQKLKEYGIAPPDKNVASKIDALFEKDNPVICPKCNSKNTELTSKFGSTACKSLHFCKDCHEPFEYFKCH